jgi:hypothetical protein
MFPSANSLRPLSYMFHRQIFSSELFQFLESPFETVPARGLYSIDTALLKGVDEPGPALPRPFLRSGALPSEIQICSDPRLPAPLIKGTWHATKLMRNAQVHCAFELFLNKE